MAVVEEAQLEGHTTFLADKPMGEIRSLASKMNLKYNRNMKKKDIISLIMEHYDDETEEEVDLVNFTIYEVRYVGPNSMIFMNANSTKSRKEYKFSSNDWVMVDQIDFDKFFDKVEKSIAANNDPHWQVRRINPITNKIKNFFVSATNIISSRKPKTLRDITLMTDESMIRLREMNVRSLKEFISLPNTVLVEKLYLSRVTAQEMKEDARRGII